MKKFFALFASFFLCVGLVGCSSSAEDNVVVTGDFGKTPKVEIKSTTPPSELVSKVLIEGKGEPLTEESMATVDYYGISLDGKEPFDESFSRPKPFNFEVGKGVIEGWTKGLVGKKVGSRVLLIIPPELAYGEAGSPPSIKPNATLVFVIDIHGGTVKKDRSALKTAQPKTDNAEGVTVKGELSEVPKVEFTKETPEPTERKVVVLSEGNGEVIQEDDNLEVFPTVYEWGNEIPSQGTASKEGVPFVLPVSKAAETDMLIGLKVGSRVLILDPSSVDHTGQKVPAYAYVFDIVGKVGQRTN